MEPIHPRAPGSPATIETATWRDLNQLRYIEKICFPQDLWPLWDLIGVLTFPNVVRLKASIDGQMVGFIAGDLRASERMAWVATVCVLPEFRGRGVGTALMRACEERLELPTIRLSVRLSNQGAVQLYEHLGYQRIGIWPGYYQDGEDALVMEKQRPNML
jgi:ribosomal protein S18 acetylase RimI-like enzyme